MLEAHENRRNGFEDYLAENAPGITVVGVVENQDKGDIAFSQAQDFMVAYPDLAGIYVTAGGPFGAAKAVEVARKVGSVKIVCFDFVDETMEYVAKGVIKGTIGPGILWGHDPAIDCTATWWEELSHQQEDCLRSDFVTKDNMSEFWQP